MGILPSEEDFLIGGKNAIQFNLEKAFDTIRRIENAEDAVLSDHIIKLGEELGEISESYLMLKSYKKPKLHAKEEATHLIEETVDAMVVCMAILAHMRVEKPEVFEMLFKKITKWEKALTEKKNTPLAAENDQWAIINKIKL